MDVRFCWLANTGTFMCLIKENGFIFKKAGSRRYSAETMKDTDYSDDQALLANTPSQAESLPYSFKQTAGDIVFYVNANKKKEYMRFKQKGAISTLSCKLLKLVVEQSTNSVKLKKLAFETLNRSCITEFISRGRCFEWQLCFRRDRIALRGCNSPDYETKLNIMMRLQFWSLGGIEYPLVAITPRSTRAGVVAPDWLLSMGQKN